MAEKVTPEQAIKTALEPIKDLASKVYPLEGLKNATAPFVFYLRLTGDENDALDGPTGLLTASFEINCVARTYAEQLALCGAVRQALKRLQGREFPGLLIERIRIRQQSPDLKETEVNLYRRMYVLQINYQEVNTDE